MKIVSREVGRLQEVYDIGVESTHNFVLHNNVIAHNCFNKAHSLAYSNAAYAAAWFKANYPTEFFVSLMSVRSKVMQPQDWATKAPIYIGEAQKFGIKFHPPDINQSNQEFTISGDSIYFGLGAIRDCGVTACKSIIAARGNTPFKSVGNFIERCNTTKVTVKVFQALALAGCFDSLGYSRKELYQQSKTIYQYLKDRIEYEERERAIVIRLKEREEAAPIVAKVKELKRIRRLKSLRDLTPEEEVWLEENNGTKLKPELNSKPLPTPPRLSRSMHQKLTPNDIIVQKGYIGCYIGAHPAHLVFRGKTRLRDITEGFMKGAAEVVSKKTIRDRRGNLMCFLTLSDGTEQCEAVVFSKTYKELQASDNLPDEGDVIAFSAKCESVEPAIKLVMFNCTKYRSE